MWNVYPFELRWLLYLLSISIVPFECFSQEPDSLRIKERYQLKIEKTNEEILVDGELNESIWNATDVASDFWMTYPVDDRRVETRNQTEVRMLYDDNFIYIGAVCHGDDDYVIQTLKRDKQFWRGDAFAVIIDPVNERTNGFFFGVNPLGVQTEGLVQGQLGRRDDRFDEEPPNGMSLAWDNKWFVETQNYPDKWTVEIAIPFKTLRYESNRTVWGINFNRIDAGNNHVHTWTPVPIQFASEDLGYSGALIWDNAPERSKGNISVIPYLLGAYSHDFEAEATDEADEFEFRAGLDAKVAVSSSLNLDITINPDFSQVEVDQQVTNLTRFDIRFPEQRLFFLENSDLFEEFAIPPMPPFFSRKLGLDDDGNNIPILYGARLSGNVNNDFRVGIMNLQTRSTGQFLAQNYTSLAIHQRVLARSVFKGYFHNRQAVNSDVSDFNRNFGLQFSYQSDDGKLSGYGHYGKAINPGLLSDNYYYAMAIGYDSKNISFFSDFGGIGNDYVNDFSFIPWQFHYDAERDTTIRVGFHHKFSRLGYTFYSDNNEKIISHEISLRNILDLKKDDWSVITNGTELGYTLNFTNTSQFQLSYSNNTNSLLFPFGFTTGEPLPAGTYNYQFLQASYQTDQRSLFGLRGAVQYGGFYNGTRGEYTMELNYRAQPWGNFSMNVVLNDVQFPEPYSDEVFWLISPRFEVNFTKSIYWTTFLQYNTQRDNFNINSRFQWRFQPMSDLFIVYTDNYTVDFFGPKNRALVIKLNYWLNL